MLPRDAAPGRKLNWIRNPSLYILLFEPPAKRWGGDDIVGDKGVWFTQWHYRNGRVDVRAEKAARSSARFISPILYADGRAEVQDFTSTIKADPLGYIYEANKDWIWYETDESEMAEDPWE